MVNISYSNSNKFVKKDGYEDCCYLVNVDSKDIDINYINEDSFEIKINKVIDELLEDDVLIYRITLEYTDKVITYEVSDNKEFSITSFNNYMIIKY